MRKLMMVCATELRAVKADGNREGIELACQKAEFVGVPYADIPHTGYQKLDPAPE